MSLRSYRTIQSLAHVAMNPRLETNAGFLLAGTKQPRGRTSLPAFSAPTPQHEARVDSAEAEAVGQDVVNVLWASSVRNVIEIAVRVGCLQVQSRRQMVVCKHQA